MFLVGNLVEKIIYIFKLWNLRILVGNFSRVIYVFSRKFIRENYIYIYLNCGI